MDATEIIDQIIGRTDNVGLADSDYANRRQRHLEYLIEEATYVWQARDWRWKRSVATLTIPVNQGWVNLPSDFGSVGRHTLVTNVATGRSLRFVDEDELREEKDRPGVTTADPSAYSIYGQGTDYEYRLQIVTNSIQVQLTFPYNKALPTIDESSNEDNIKVIPAQYHQSVLIPAVRSLAAYSKGDQSWEAHSAQRDKGLRLMIRGERLPQDTLGQFPSFFGGRMY